MNEAIQNGALPARLRPPTPLSDEEPIAFSQANKPCRAERPATGEILVITPSSFENNRRGAYGSSAQVAVLKGHPRSCQAHLPQQILQLIHFKPPAQPRFCVEYPLPVLS